MNNTLNDVQMYLYTPELTTEINLQYTRYTISNPLISREQDQAIMASLLSEYSSYSSIPK